MGIKKKIKKSTKQTIFLDWDIESKSDSVNSIGVMGKKYLASIKNVLNPLEIHHF